MECFPIDLLEKYGLSITPEMRIYKEDLSKRDLDAEGATPLYMDIGETRIKTRKSWIHFLPSLVDYLLERNPIPYEALFAYRTEWSKKAIFSPMEVVNSKEVRPGLWLNCNNTAVHSIFLVTDFLRLFEVPLSEASLYIHRVPSCEPTEVIDYLVKRREKAFLDWLRKKGKGEEAIAIIRKRIAFIERKYFKSNAPISRLYNDLWLFDSLRLAENYLGKIKKEIQMDPYFEEKRKPGLIRRVDYCILFYRQEIFPSKKGN